MLIGETGVGDLEVVAERPVDEALAAGGRDQPALSAGGKRGTVRCARSIQLNFHSCESLNAA